MNDLIVPEEEKASGYVFTVPIEVHGAMRDACEACSSPGRKVYHYDGCPKMVESHGIIMGVFSPSPRKNRWV